MTINKVNKKLLIQGHTFIGLLVVFLFYISTYFGSLTLFLPYIQTWESPSKHIHSTKDYTFNIDQELDEIIANNHLLTRVIEIIPPNFKDPSLTVSSKNQTTLHIDPNTNEILDTDFEKNSLSTFFNDLHTGGFMGLTGRVIMGVVSLGMIFLLLSGIIMYFSSKKLNKNSWFKWHKDLSFLLVPYIIIFCLTGGFMGFMLPNSSFFAKAATNNQENNMRKLVSPIIFKKKRILKKSKNQVLVKPLSNLIEIAQENYPDLKIEKIAIYNYKKDNSQTHFIGYLKNNRSLTARVNRMTITLDSQNGKVIEKKEIKDSHIIKKTLSAFYFLHFLTDEKIIIRVVLFIGGVLMALSLVFGYMIWAEKRLKDIHEPYYYSFINRFTIAVMLGVIPATAGLLAIYWIIPPYLIDKEIWLRGSFYLLWSVALFISIISNSSIKTGKIYLYGSSFFFFLAVFLHGKTTGFFIHTSLLNNLNTVFAVDLTLLFCGLISFVLALKIENIPQLSRFTQGEKNV
ncbi:MAG: PepSY domain-containing protein [Campylobacterales bacterium]|nr:PepSY domain-containing protein [Campylobacterales bacterium]